MGGALRAAGRVVLAVSGGRDSITLLHAAARAAPECVALVATFDHGTGAHAARAAALVQRRATELGFPVAAGRAAAVASSEAAWRAARWRFLREAAAGVGAPVATAHTADDQVETVFMRLLRAAGPRGLAGLAAGGTVVRPLLPVARETVAEYAAAEGVRWVDDPANEDRRHLRTRVRRDILPALERVRPGFGAALLALGARAAAWRRDAEAVAAALARVDRGGARLEVSRAHLAALDAEALALLWPALAARVGVTLDRRGTRRASGFTIEGRAGREVPLAGGAVLRCAGDRFVLYRRTPDIDPVAPDALRLGPHAVVGRFRFTRTPDAGAGRSPSLWEAAFDRDAALTVRGWRAGDRMPAGAGGRARRVKRFLADARVPAYDRPGWPVVVADGAIAWIPGVRRSDAATVRPGRPAVRYECDRNDG